MQQTVETQPVCIQWIRSELTGEFTEFLLDFLGNANIKNALHQCLNREEMGVDVFHISHGLLKRIRGLISTTNWCGMHLCVSSARTMLLLQILEYTTRQRSECLESCPAQFLLLTKRGVLSNQPVVLSVKALTVRTLAGLFWHVEPEAREPS